MIFTDMELFVLLWIISAMVLGFIVSAILYIPDWLAYIRKTPEERATDWVNARIEKDHNFKEI